MALDEMERAGVRPAQPCVIQLRRSLRPNVLHGEEQQIQALL
jgi:hypothetical protein